MKMKNTKSLLTRLCKIVFLIGGIALLNQNILFAQSIANPVLPRVADAGVIKYNGKYYIGGVYTNGSLYESTDLVHWTGPVHVFSMNNEWTNALSAKDSQIHANDIIYLNGKFHMYWSVNYWGNDKTSVHIGHAFSDSILGPYHEPVQKTWMDNRIDPMVFRDNDGRLYMYMVRFSDGNAIWVRPMKDAQTFDGDPLFQFSSLPSTWETMDNRVNEGPWVLTYRNRYYMMYNANHTGPQWGNYQLGVAEANSPVTFNQGTKYSYPVLQSNQVILEDTYADILRFGKDPFFNYTQTPPEKNWNSTLLFDDSAWTKGLPGFGSDSIEGTSVRRISTQWKTQKLYTRKKFNITRKKIDNLALRITHDGATKVYLNGQTIYDIKVAGYCLVNLDNKLSKVLRDGVNLIAVESEKGRSNYLDISLFDMRHKKADDILFSPGQPNILRGPNGFEWWLIYMANKNKESRGQYINRVHFFNKTLYVEGISSSNTEGYYPEPTPPTYGETFDNALRLRDYWTLSDESWAVVNNEITYSKGQTSQALLKESLSGTSRYVEAGIKTTGNAGLVALWCNSQTWVRVGINVKDLIWYFKSCLDGVEAEQAFPLPADFKPGVYHSLTILRNGESFNIRLDNIPAPGKHLFHTGINDSGVSGFFTENSQASFDGFLYTLGWDESDDEITSWGNAQSGTPSVGNAKNGPSGMKVCKSSDYQSFKGDMLSQYEFSLQVTNASDQGTSGIFPVYVDKDNYIATSLNYPTRKLQVRVVKKGKEIALKEFTLETTSPQYADMNYTDFLELRHTFASPTWIGGIQSVSVKLGNVLSEYLSNDIWSSLPVPLQTDTLPANVLKISFKPVKAEAIRFLNVKNDVNLKEFYKVNYHEVWKDSYNLRAVKRDGKLLFFVDGTEIFRMDETFGNAQVGLFSNGCMPVFNGIMRYHIPGSTK